MTTISDTARPLDRITRITPGMCSPAMTSPGAKRTEWPVLVSLSGHTQGMLDDLLGGLPGSPWLGASP
jgi:hypothetical protein